ncbi:hypothetical protein AVEN_43697-1 [Araneus ventricosus]|uniref:Uncharacterized protein n=1 Tax=Araneus ventricosus TaxID=182803 RepID=A0A4Y2BZ26_ARAVE|nr:hypothetical protein AVEN_43697-1 [Araneus ventricosus]
MIGEDLLKFSESRVMRTIAIGIPDNTAIFHIGSDMIAVQGLQGKFTGKFCGSALENFKPAICLRDHGINVLGKIKFGVKDDPKIRDCI